MLYIRSIIFVFLIANNISLCYSQHKTTLLLKPDSVTGDLPLFQITMLAQPVLFSKKEWKIPDSLGYYCILECHTNYRQYIYDLRKKRENIKDSFILNQIKRVLGYDSTQFSSTPVNESVKLISGFNLSKERVIIIDTDNDSDFKEEQIYGLKFLSDTVGKKREKFIKVSNVEIYNRDIKQVIKKQYEIWPELFDFSYSPIKDTACYVEVSFKTHISQALLGGQNIVYVYQNDIGKAYDSSNSFFLIRRPGDGSLKNRRMSAFYQVGDYFKVNDKYAKIPSISPGGNQLVIEFAENGEQPYGVKVDLKAPKIFSKNLMDNKEFNSFSFLHQKYLLLDFWGTWCAPCKKLTPQLKSLQQQYDKKGVQVVSIAYDNEEKPVLDYIKANELSWINIFQKNGPQTEESVVKQYKVMAYPTFILIDKLGKIIFRDEGAEGFANLQQFLEKLKL
jgi:thiol-disulfide isomerase/thioredoxin